MNPFFLKAFSPYVPNAGNGGSMTVNDFLVGIVHPRQEILALIVALKVTGKSSGVTYNLSDSDLDTTVAALVSKQRATYMGVGDAVNAPPDVMRDIGQYGLAEDAWQAQLIARTGAAVPATGAAAETLTLLLPIPFANVQKENPNLSAKSAGQFYSGAKVDIDSPAPNLPLNIVHVNGTFVATAVACELWALVGAIRPLLWMAPAMKYFVRAASSQGQENEGGPLFDELVFALQDATQFPNTNDNIQIVIDGKNYLLATPTQNIPLGFSLTVKANETATPSYDISQNTKARPAAPRTGRLPLVWIHGLETPLEREWPYVTGGRSINFGQRMTAVAQLAFWRTTPITTAENMAHLSNMMADSRLQAFFSEKSLSASQIDAIKRINFTDLAIDGGGSAGVGAMNSDLSLWKPRQFAPRRGTGG